MFYIKKSVSTVKTLNFYSFTLTRVSLSRLIEINFYESSNFGKALESMRWEK